MKFLTDLYKNLFKKKPKRLLRISTPDGYIEIGGKREFTEPMFDDLRENSPKFRELLQDIFGNLSHENLITALREAGVSEQEIKDFEDDNLWDDWIYERNK